MNSDTSEIEVSVRLKVKNRKSRNRNIDNRFTNFKSNMVKSDHKETSLSEETEILFYSENLLKLVKKYLQLTSDSVEGHRSVSF